MQTQHAELCNNMLPVLPQIYLRVPLHAREDLAEWRSILQNIMESSATATRLVLVTLAHSDAHRRQPLLEETILINSVCFLILNRAIFMGLCLLFVLPASPDASQAVLSLFWTYQCLVSFTTAALACTAHPSTLVQIAFVHEVQVIAV